MERVTPRTAALVVIGDEILSGQVQDSAVQYLAGWLDRNGCELQSVEIVPDDSDRLTDALERCMARYELVFTTGGLGITHDDITVPRVARMLGREVVLNEQLLRLLNAHYRGRSDEASDMMARAPEGATLLKNWKTIVPGFNVDDRLFLLPGVPQLVKDILAGIKEQFGEVAETHAITIGVWAEETRFSDRLGEIQRCSAEVKIGSYPFWRGNEAGCNISIKSREEAPVAAAADAIEDLLREVGLAPHRGGISAQAEA